MRVYVAGCFLVICLCFSSVVIAAEGGGVSGHFAPPDPDLARKAIGMAVQADAYNMYCGKDTQLTQDFLDRFEKQGMDSELLGKLTEYGAGALKESVKTLVDGKIECKNVDLLMARIKLMRDLRVVSYQLNGVDPKDIPKENVDDLPELKELMSMQKGEGEGEPKSK